ncbi:MAG: aldo/keto reductase, partial [bacterium]|nr:aldo/keto reductase [bacterium]
ELLELCHREGLGIIPYNPLAAGMLTGKYTRDTKLDKTTRLGRNKDYHGRFWQERNFDALDMLKEVADGAGKTMIELSLQWLMTQPVVDSIILGASKLERLESDALKACNAVWQHIRGGHFAYNR